MTKPYSDWEMASKMLVVLRYGTLDECRQVLEGGADVDQTFKINGILKPAIHIAVERGSIDIVEMLLNNGGAVDRRDSACRTALHISIEFGYEHISQVLLEHRADVNLQDGDGISPLHYAVQHGSVYTTRRLIEKGADVSRRDSRGRTPLMYVCSSSGGNFELMILLINGGARADVVDTSGTGVLSHILTSSKFNFKMVEVLLQNGARPDIRSNLEDSTPIHDLLYSKNQEKWKSLELMLKFGCPVDLPTSENQTPLDIAAIYGDELSIRILIRAGANPNVVNSLGITPLFHAFCYASQPQAIIALMQGGAKMTKDELETEAFFCGFTKDEMELVTKLQNRTRTLKEQSRMAIWKLLGKGILDLENFKDQIPKSLYTFLQFGVDSKTF